MKRFSPILVAGLLVLPWSAGCDNKPPSPSTAQGSKAAPKSAHPTEGPHKGDLIELGAEEYHLELIHDDDAHKITVYVLDKEAKESVPTGTEPITVNLTVDSKPVQFSIPAVRQESDPKDKTSRFEVVDEKLCEAMDAPKAKPRFNITIGGKPYNGSPGAHKH